MHLFGVLRAEIEQHVELRWVPGFIAHMRIDLPRFLSHWPTGDAFAAALLALPCCACLRSLELGGALRERDLSELLSHPTLACLRELNLDSMWWLPSRVRDWSGLPRVERLRLVGIHQDNAPLELPALHTLELTMGSFDEAEVLLRTARAPRLAALSLEPLDPSSAARDPSGLASCLGLPWLAELRHVSLKISDSSELGPYVEVLADTPAAARLERIELHAPGHTALPDAAHRHFGERIHLVPTS